METLSAQDTQNLNHGIQQIYALDDFESFGRSALTIVHQLVPSDLPTFHATEMRTRQISHTFLPGFPSFTPEMEKVFDRHFGEHPIVQHMPQTLHGAHQLSDFISQQALHRLEGLYQQFLRPLDQEEQITFFVSNAISDNWRKLTQTDATLVGFSLNRPQSFTERDRLMLNLLRPHLFQAYSNVQKLHQVHQDLSQLQQSITHLGHIRIDTTGALQWITPQAELWLAQYLEPATSFGHLPDALWSWVQHQVQNLIVSPHLPCLPLQIKQGSQRLVIRLVADPAHNRYSLLLEEQRRQSSHLSLAVLGLSQRETEVLARLLQGKDNKAMAAQLNIGASTINKHLESIYRKLGVQSRTEAIAQVLEQLGCRFTP
jgi:DNA-binding CsgD family transcriptional regulator